MPNLKFMKLTIKFFLLLLLVTNFSFAQEWVKTDLTEFASINFPVASELIETGQESVYNAKDEVAFYVVSVRKLTAQQSSQITKEDISTIYQGVVNGALTSSNAELISINEIYIEEFPAVELESHAQSNPGLPNQRFKRVIYLNQNIISIDFWPLTNQTVISDEMKAKFFNSFSIKPNEVSQTSTIENQNSIIYDTGYNTGLLIGQIVFYVILIALLLGIIFLIRFLVKKNRKKKSPIPAKEPSSGKVTNVICQNCNAENKGDIKYCSICGFELKKA